MAKSYGLSATAFHWDPKKVILVIDIDDTICHSEIRKILGGRTPTLIPIADSKETLCTAGRAISDRVRDRAAAARIGESRAWLEKCGYPAGPVLTSPGVTTTSTSSS